MLVSLPVVQLFRQLSVQVAPVLGQGAGTGAPLIIALASVKPLALIMFVTALLSEPLLDVTAVGIMTMPAWAPPPKNTENPPTRTPAIIKV